MWRTIHTVNDGRSPVSEPRWDDPLGGPSERSRIASEAPASLGPATLPIPDLVGLSIHDARRIARLSDLQLVVEAHSSDAAFWGRVVRQRPEAGLSVETGARIAVDVGSRPLTTVPDVRGSEEAEALEAISRVGLIPGRRTARRSDTLPADHVIRTRPRAGASVPRGTRVSIIVSAPPRFSGGSRHHGAKRVRSQRLGDGAFMTLPGDR